MRKRILGALLICCICGSFFCASNRSQKSFTPESNEHEIKAQEGKAEQEDIQEDLTVETASFVSENENKTASAPEKAMEQETVREEAKTAPVVTNELNLYKNRWNIYLTRDEIDLLAQIVWVEACGEPEEGQEAVVEVVFNRMRSPDYPDTLYDVLSEDHPVQFCSWKLRDTARPTQKEYQSIYHVLYGQTNILRNDTMYFSTFALTSNVDKKICCHYFCY